ncbi:hypothetical protein N658DRAFT_20551 [Parathielavia hyrcaniae]|uniref:Uncharacterized protein n=1 Tax=Parathielavia hyrcaniae TaxID=113614 RepID=A0AAN6QBG1_9PEZI|nr:hypothetical protein N658DRAFT_20551 [Parathielavia hyrcaniae]
MDVGPDVGTGQAHVRFSPPRRVEIELLNHPLPGGKLSLLTPVAGSHRLSTGGEFATRPSEPLVLARRRLPGFHLNSQTPETTASATARPICIISTFLSSIGPSNKPMAQLEGSRGPKHPPGTWCPPLEEVTRSTRRPSADFRTTPTAPLPPPASKQNPGMSPRIFVAIHLLGELDGELLHVFVPRRVEAMWLCSTFLTEYDFKAHLFPPPPLERNPPHSHR